MASRRPCRIAIVRVSKLPVLSPDMLTSWRQFTYRVLEIYMCVEEINPIREMPNQNHNILPFISNTSIYVIYIRADCSVDVCECFLELVTHILFLVFTLLILLPPIVHTYTPSYCTHYSNCTRYNESLAMLHSRSFYTVR